MMPIKLGASPLSWMNSDFPALGSHISVDHCLSELSLIGYEGVELEDPFRKVMNRFPALLSSRELSLIGGWHALKLLENPLEQELEELQKHLELLEMLGGRVANLADCSRAIHRDRKTPLSKQPSLTDAEWDRLCEGLEKAAELVENAGMVSAYHHHMGTAVQSASDIERLMNGTEKLGLLYDAGHLVYAGADPHAILANHLSRITHVHCKSVRPNILEKHLQEDSSFIDAVIDGIFTVPGDRQQSQKQLIDFSWIIKTLVEGNYQGWIVMEAEQDPNQADPFTYAQLGYHTLRSLLIEHQFHHTKPGVKAEMN